MTEYLLITTLPLYSSKSFHKSWDEVKEKINEIMDLTEEYYELSGKTFEPKYSKYTGSYQGMLIYKIAPEKPHLVRLVGDPKNYTKPNLSNLDELDTDIGEDAGTREKSETTLHSNNRRGI